jgi:hypothetical protein
VGHEVLTRELWDLGNLQEWPDRRIIMNNGLIEPEMEAVGEIEMIDRVDLTENDSTPGFEQVMSLFIGMGSGSTLEFISTINRNRLRPSASCLDLGTITTRFTRGIHCAKSKFPDNTRLSS